MKYDTEQMTFIGTAGTAEESAALALHYEIMAAAQTAAASLLDLARKIKRMRDTSGYKALGFDSLEAYAETAERLGNRQRRPEPHWRTAGDNRREIVCSTGYCKL